MERKFLRVEVKDADQGSVSAVFATLGVIDHDGDVTLPGAFKTQDVILGAYAHSTWAGALPVGKGTIREDGNKAIFDGQFFMDTAGGRDTFTTVKELGNLGEWSYGYEVKESEAGTHEDQDVRFLKELDVIEVSPCLQGAGIGTATISAKAKVSFPDQAEKILGDLNALIDRAKSWGTSEEKAGRVVSAANHERLTNVAASLSEAHTTMTQFLVEHDPNKTRRELEAEFLRFYSGLI